MDGLIIRCQPGHSFRWRWAPCRSWKEIISPWQGHSRSYSKGVWECVTERDESGGGSEQCEESRKPVLYVGIHLLRPLGRIIDKLNDPCGLPQVPCHDQNLEQADALIH
jgi:hypothetical protein